jgi:putative phosphoribosyl transferase
MQYPLLDAFANKTLGGMPMFFSEPAYRDRADAGRRLAERLLHYRKKDVQVLALPRGGVPVEAIVAERLAAPLDVFVVRKIGAPGNPEYALGAVAEGNGVRLDHERVQQLGLVQADLVAEIREETQELERRVRVYRSGRLPPELEGRTVILVDDGLATGATAEAAIRALRVRRPHRLVLAVGVAPAQTCDRLSPEVDELVCPCIPESFGSGGAWHREFPQIPDDGIRQILQRFRPPALEARLCAA